MATAEELVVRASMRDELSQPVRKVRGEVKALGDEADRTGRAADRSTGALGRMSRGLGGLRRVTGRALTTGLRLTRYGILGVAAALGGAITLGIKTAASMQNAAIGFTTMLGSAKKADAFLRKLRKFAAETPFEFPELQTAASSLISIGIKANKVIPIMTTLGNVTSGMGTGSEGIKRATVALQQMNAAGRITAEDLNQLRDAGIPVYDLLAKATGKTKAEVAGLASKGKLGAKELGQMMHALETGKGLERFNGLMAKQSKSLGGVWSTLKDNVTMGLAGALQPAIPGITRMVTKLGELAGKWLPEFSKWLEKTMHSAGKFLDGFKNLGGLDSLKRAGKAVLDILGSFAPDATSAGDAASQFATLADHLADVLEFVSRHTTALKVIVLALALAFGGPVTATLALGAAFIWAWKKSKTFREIMETTAIGVLKMFSGMLHGVELFLGALGHIPGFGWAKDAAKKVHDLRTNVDDLAESIRSMRDKTVTIRMQTVGTGRFAGKTGLLGDTATSRARGHGGGLDRTLAMHSRLAPSGVKISNALTGGGGTGRGSGDHQRGRALDLVGPGLGSYKRRLEQAGGWAQFHGSGGGRHLHGVYPAGDTKVSATSRTGGGASGGAPIIVNIDVHGNASEVDKAALERAVRRGIAAARRDQLERGAV